MEHTNSTWVGKAAGSHRASLQQPSSPLMASTQGLLDDTTQQLQLMDLSCSLHGPGPASDSAPGALCAGFLQASTGPHKLQDLHLTGMHHAAPALDVLPRTLPAPSNTVDAGLVWGTAAAQHAVRMPFTRFAART